MTNKKNVLVTGSSRGIGAQIALAFASNGYQVALNCINSTQKMDALVGWINTNRSRAVGIRADVSNYDEARGMFRFIGENLGSIDVLVNNAGISHIGLFSEMTPDQWNKLMDVNIKSVFNCCHLAAQEMVHKKNGVIINISSVWGAAGASCEAVYSASKGAVDSFTKALAKELGPSGIRVNAIACGVIDTQMNQWLDEDEKTALTESIPLMRFGTTSDIASLAVFLASDSAGYITGQVINADGGFI